MTQQDSEVVGFSKEYLIKEEKFDLIDESIKEEFRSTVEKHFGIAELDNIGIMYRHHNHKPYESFIRAYAHVSSMSYDALSNLRKDYPYAFIDSVKLIPETRTLKLTILIAGIWVKKK
jgi:hypothetical protein